MEFKCLEKKKKYLETHWGYWPQRTLASGSIYKWIEGCALKQVNNYSDGVNGGQTLCKIVSEFGKKKIFFCVYFEKGIFFFCGFFSKFMEIKFFFGKTY